MQRRVAILLGILCLGVGVLQAQQDARLMKAQEKITRLQRRVEQLSLGVQRADSAVLAARELIRAAEDSLKWLGREEESIKKASFEAEKRARKDVNQADENTIDSLRIEYQNIEKEIDMRLKNLERRARTAQRFYENGLRGEKRAKSVAKKVYTDRKNAEKAVAQAQADYLKLEKSLQQRQQKIEEKRKKQERKKEEKSE